MRPGKGEIRALRSLRNKAMQDHPSPVPEDAPMQEDNMPVTRRLFLAGAIALGLAGCSSSPAGPVGPTEPVTLVSAFEGQRAGKGLFRIWLSGAE